jgi:hypothetical protein
MKELKKYDTDEIIAVNAGKLSRNYKAYKGTFAGLVYNCIEKKALPGFYYEENLVAGAESRDSSVLSVTLTGRRTGKKLMEIIGLALENSSAFPVDGGKPEYSISVKGGGKS